MMTAMTTTAGSTTTAMALAAPSIDNSSADEHLGQGTSLPPFFLSLFYLFSFSFKASGAGPGASP
jgi:hypothetical protein